VQATAFVAHPYRIPTIGWPSDIKAWTLADLQNFYHTWYAPNNCTLVLVGDVEPEQVFALVEKYYGAIPRGPATLPVRTVEPEQTGERRLTIERSGQNPLLQVRLARHLGRRSARAGAEPAADHPHRRRCRAVAPRAGRGAQARGGGRQRLV
jgi:predicted Zn-dependent peptidase